jgi:hypothetical protein
MSRAIFGGVVSLYDPNSVAPCAHQNPLRRHNACTKYPFIIRPHLLGAAHFGPRHPRRDFRQDHLIPPSHTSTRCIPKIVFFYDTLLTMAVPLHPALRTSIWVVAAPLALYSVFISLAMIPFFQRQWVFAPSR